MVRGAREKAAAKGGEMIKYSQTRDRFGLGALRERASPAALTFCPVILRARTFSRSRQDWDRQRAVVARVPATTTAIRRASSPARTDAGASGLRR